MTKGADNVSKHSPPYPNAATDPFNQVPGMNRPTKTMATETDLPPSSIAAFTEALQGESGSLDAWLEAHDESEVAAHIEAYANACVSSATAEKDAEIDALRTRLEDTVRDSTNKIEALRAEVEDYRENGASAVRFAPNSAHWSAELRRLFGDDAREGIEVLEQRLRDSLARAEQLAEALQLAEEHIGALTPEWYGAGQRVLTAIRAAKQPERDLP